MTRISKRSPTRITDQMQGEETAPLINEDPPKRLNNNKKTLICFTVTPIILFLSFIYISKPPPQKINPPKKKSHFFSEFFIGENAPKSTPIHKDPKINLPFAYSSLKNKIFYQKMVNGVEWLHVNDEKTESCAAAIGLSVGSYEETQGDFYGGMAHLLEHSFFLVEGPELRNGIEEWNAFTTSQKTDFIFSCKKDYFLNFFDYKWDEITLFKPTDKILDEISAVNNE